MPRIKINELETFEYIQLPRALMYGSEYKDLSNDAKLLYSLLFDRLSNRDEGVFIESDRCAFIFYTVEEICFYLNVSKDKAIKLKRELINKKLIEEVRQGLGKSNKIYLLRVDWI